MKSIPSTPYGDIEPHWRPQLDALDAWCDGIASDAIPIPKRPFLYQPPGDVDAVRNRVDEHAGLRDGIVKAATDALTGDLPDPALAVTETYRPMSPWISRMVSCSNAWLLTGDNRFAERAWEIAEVGMIWPNWIGPEHQPLTLDLRSAAVVRSFAVMRDRLDGWLDTARRDRLIAYLVGETRRFVEISDAHSEWWTYSTHNWRTVLDGSYGIAALSVMDSLPDDLLRRALKHGMIGSFVILDNGDVDGGWFEGVSYWRYGIGEAVEFIDALHRATDGAVDLFSHPYLQKTGDFAVFLTWPDGRVYHWGDCGEKINATHLMARLANITQRGDWQEYVRRFPAQPTLDTLFWEDPSLEPVPFDTLPKVKHFRGTEVAVLRAGWGDDDLIVGVKAGDTLANHTHLDHGSFVIDVAGHSLIGDAGHWDYATGTYFFNYAEHRYDYPGLDTACHSTILADGRGQEWGPERHGKIVGSGDFPATDSMPGWAFATVDSSESYPQLEMFVRYTLLIRPDRVIVIDDIRSHDPARIEWRVVLPYPVRRLPGESCDRAWPTWVTGPKSGPSLTMKWLEPFSDDGLIAQETQLDAIYGARSGPAHHACRTLSVSPLIRQRTTQIAVAMRLGHDSQAVDPGVRVENAYRSLQIIVDTDLGQRTWQIMWGQPGIQAFSR